MSGDGADVRALKVRSALADAWSRKQGPYLTDTRGDLTLIIEREPEMFANKAGIYGGVSCRVQLHYHYGQRDGYEIPIDQTRRFWNPPAHVVEKRGDEREIRFDPTAALLDALWDSIFEVPNAQKWGDPRGGTVTTIYAEEPANNPTLQSQAATHSDARAGAGSFGTTFAQQVGQALPFPGFYVASESWLLFDTSAIDTDEILDVVLSLDGSIDSSTTDFTAIVAPSSTYTGGSVLGLWVPGDDLNDLTVLATWDSSTYSSDYNDFTSTPDFSAAINKTGNTALILFSDRLANGDAPTGNEFVNFTIAGSGGPGTDPKLTITHESTARSGSGSESAASEVNADGQKSAQDTSTITAENAVDATGASARSASAEESLEATTEAAGQTSRAGSSQVDSTAGVDTSGAKGASEDASLAAQSEVEASGAASKADSTTIGAESETSATGQPAKAGAASQDIEAQASGTGSSVRSATSSVDVQDETQGSGSGNHTGGAAIDAVAGLEASGAGGKQGAATFESLAGVEASGFKSIQAEATIETNAGVNAAGVPVSGSAASITTDAEVSATGVKGSRDSAIIAAISTIDYAATTAREGPARRRNWIINGGFETSTNGWGPLGTSSTIQRNTNDRVSGVASGEVTAGAPGATNRGITTPIELKEGDEWTFQAWIKGKGNAIGRSISMSMYSSELGTWRSQSFTLTDEWQFCYISWPSPGNASNIIALFAYTALEAGEGFLIDNAQLERGLVPTEYIETDGKSESAPGFLELPLSGEVDGTGHAEKAGSSSIGVISEVELVSTHNRLGSAELTLEGDIDPTGEAGHSASISLEIVGSISVEGESTRSDSSSIEVDVDVEAAGEQGQAAIDSAAIEASIELVAEGFKSAAGQASETIDSELDSQGASDKQGAAQFEVRTALVSAVQSTRSGEAEYALQVEVNSDGLSGRTSSAEALTIEIIIDVETQVNQFVSVINLQGRSSQDIEVSGRVTGDINLEGRRS